MNKSNNSINKKTLKWFWHFGRQDKLFFWVGVIGAGLGSMVKDILPPFIVAKAFNQVQFLLSTGQDVAFNDFKTYILLYVLAMIVGFIVVRIQVWCIWKFEIRTMERIITHLFNHIQVQSAKFHANRFGGALVNQVNKFTNALERFVDELTWGVVVSVVMSISSLILLALINIYLAVILFIVMAVYFAIMVGRMKIQYPYNQELATSESQRTAMLADAITNISTVRAFAGERHENAIFSKQAKKTSKAYYALMKVTLDNEIISHNLTDLMNITAFAVGIFVVTNLNMPVGGLYLAVSYTLTLSRRMWESTKTFRNINRALGDASDMTQILDITPEIQDPAVPKKMAISKGSIKFDKVDFSFNDNQEEQQVFKNFNLDIEGGEKIGLVGHSGGGKTTITKLLLRFIDIQSGSISIDGVNIRNVRQLDLRQQIAYVEQEPLLFHRTIAENIAYGKPNATKSEIEKVIKMAHADEFIKNLPHGLNTFVGERGVKLSGGQRQRIAIARAMLKDAPILILDEATSALDSENEKLIQDALWRLMQNRTSIVIAHRLSTVQKLDKIVVLEKGRIVEKGTHSQLLKENGTYASLWKHQIGGFIEE